MDFYQVLKTLQDTGQFDKLRAEIFSRPSIQKQFEVVQQQLVNELSSSPLLQDVPLKMRHARLPQIFNSFRLAVRKTSVSNDIHSILWNALNEMAPELYSAVETAISQPYVIKIVQPSASPNMVADKSETGVQAALGPNTIGDSQLSQSIATIVEATPSSATVTKEIAENLVTIDSCQKSESQKRGGIKGSKKKKRPRLTRMDSKLSEKNKSHSISDDDHVPAKKRNSIATFAIPQEPISRRVEIWWPLDKTWYGGVVTDFRARDKKHHIQYDDDEIEWLDLLKEKWRYEQ